MVDGTAVWLAHGNQGWSLELTLPERDRRTILHSHLVGEGRLHVVVGQHALDQLPVYGNLLLCDADVIVNTLLIILSDDLLELVPILLFLIPLLKILLVVFLIIYFLDLPCFV